MRKKLKSLLPHPKVALSTPFFIPGRNNRGVALILTVGVLALILLVGTSFAINTILDLKSSKNFKNNTEAEYFAEAGINRAVSELLYGTEGFVSNAVDSSTETWAGNSIFTTNIGNGGYTVDKIYDCAGQIYINDANPNLSAMLENLVAVLGAPLAAGDGSAIVAGRPAAGYITKEAIIEVLPGATLSGKKAKYEKIKDCITVQAFVDNDVINPLDTITPYAASPRAPVNVNTASRETLIAVLTGIRSVGILKFGAASNPVSFSISSGEAASLADHLINNRPYATYDQLWVALLNAETLGYIAFGDAALVMANANPNTDLMRANPNYSWRCKHASSQGYYQSPLDNANTGVPIALDKTMLAVSTTEFCFNSGGYYEINATGFVKDSSGAQIATKRLQAVVKLFDIWRQSTQAEFAQGTTGNTDLYPEPAVLPAAAYDGQIMLAMSKSATPNSGIPHFLVSFPRKLNGLDADSAGGNPARSNYNGAVLEPNIASIVNPADPGELFADGLFFPRDAAVSNYWFYPSNNIDAVSGTLEVWFKPNWDYRQVTFPVFNAGKIFEAKNAETGGGWPYSDMDIYMAPGTQEIHVRIHDKNGVESYIKYGLNRLDSGAHDWKRPGMWHHIAITWNFPGSVTLWLDGSQVNSVNFTDPPKPFVDHNGLEFGCDGQYQEPPNGTFGEARIFGSPGSTNIGVDASRGIYYDVGDAYFESSLYTPNSNPNKGSRLGTISWTEHTADISGNPIVPGADITFDLYNGSGWIGNSGSRSNPAGNPLNLPVAAGASIKYKANFLATAGSAPLDTPLLDDVTITYLKGVKILYWRERFI